MLRYIESLVKTIQKEPWAKGTPVDDEFWPLLMEWVENKVLSDFLNRIIRQVDDIVEIDPDLSEPQILEMATRYMVGSLGASHASVRIYDPQTEQMLSYGSYPYQEKNRETFIPLEGSIAGEVVKSRQPCVVPNILEEERYRDKEVVHRRGVHSLMAIPLEIPRFFPGERDTVGVIQVYYSEKDRVFSLLEIQMANLMAKRLSFVVARKRILALDRSNEKRKAIVGHIFRTLGSRGGIKVKEVFNQVIPELADMVNLQSSALFSISDDLEHVILEAGYPEAGGYHSIGKSFHIRKEPAFDLLLHMRDYSGELVYEVVTPSYILVVDTQKSEMISKDLREFAAIHNINSILYVPLTVDGETTHVMTFDALDHRQRYRDDEIDIFLFLGNELMKAQKMERLDDALHDFKNPAIATAGFARRLKKLLDEGECEGSSEQVKKYADIIFAETSRLQELALSIYQVGKEQVVNLTEVLKRRFEINREAIIEQLKQNITLNEGPFDPELKVRCYSIHLERVFDNLLSNATKAIPIKGGTLGIRTYRDCEWACAEITNTGLISEEDRMKLSEGEGHHGRGLYITYRIIRLINGKIDIMMGKDTTTFVVRFPFHGLSQEE